jgi:hypothetical protein
MIRRSRNCHLDYPRSMRLRTLSCISSKSITHDSLFKYLLSSKHIEARLSKCAVDRPQKIHTITHMSYELETSSRWAMLLVECQLYSLLLTELNITLWNLANRLDECCGNRLDLLMFDCTTVTLESEPVLEMDTGLYASNDS